MPADDGLRLDEDKNAPPPGPESRERHPEGPVERREPGPRMLVYEDGQLLAERELYDGLVRPVPNERRGAAESCSE